jgi:hypothetical protein
MWETIVAWRNEILSLLAWVSSWWVFKYKLKQPFFKLMLPGVLLGLAIEFMTEPEWTYFVQIYIWRDVSPFVIVSWGLMFTWLITCSDFIYQKIFETNLSLLRKSIWKIRLTDLIVGIPLFVGNELLGLHVLKVWKYNPILHWDTVIPMIDYPVEAFVIIVFFIIAMPSAVRFWKE